MPCASAVRAVGDADVECFDVTEGTSADEGGPRYAKHGCLALHLCGGPGTVFEGAGDERLRCAGLRTVVGALFGESLHVGGEDGFAPSDGEGVGRAALDSSLRWNDGRRGNDAGWGGG